MAFGSRERLQRLAMEAEITAREKAEAKALKKTTPAKKKAASTRKASTTETAVAGRMKMVWRVLDSKSKVVATFPFPKKDDAIAKAADRSQKSGTEFRVQSAKVPMED